MKHSRGSKGGKKNRALNDYNRIEKLYCKKNDFGATFCTTCCEEIQRDPEIYIKGYGELNAEELEMLEKLEQMSTDMGYTKFDEK